MNLRYGLLIILILFVATINAAQYVAGDLAPKDAPDGQLNAGDLVLLQRMIQGDLSPTTLEQTIADVAPLSAPDLILNAADMLILQRAILGEITLLPINISPPAPTLDAVSSPTSQNPYQITGTATAGTTVYIYVNSNLQHQITSQADGTFSVDIFLVDGINNIYATEYDGSDESALSNIVQIEYINTISRTQGGNITEDTVWTPGAFPQPYIITSNLTVDAGVLFVLQPGTTLLFDDGKSLQINGELRISGIDTDPVILTSSSQTPVPGSWAGIKINSGANNVVIDNVFIEWAYRGIVVNAGSVNTLITNSTIQNIAQEGILIYSDDVTVSGNNINNAQYGIHIRDASPLIISNNINNISGIGLFMYNGGPGTVITPYIKTNVIDSNASGIKINAQFGDIDPVIDSGNVITNNNYGLEVYKGSFGIAHPQIHNNEIHTNSTYNLLAGGGPTAIDAAGNWWGTVNISEIAVSIYDADDESNRRIVDYSGFLDAANGNPVPGNYLPRTIIVNTTLTADATYQALGSMRVETGAVLTIEEGAVLQFGTSMGLLVDGTLQVNGTALNPAVFTSSNPIPAAGDWPGIKLNTQSTSNVVDGAVIEYAVTGINVKAASNDSFITNSTIQNNKSYGIYFNKVAGTASNNVISRQTIDAYASGIYILESSPLIDNNTIYKNKHGIYIAGYNAVEQTSPQIINNKINNNTDGIYSSFSTAQISGNIISNNNGGEVFDDGAGIYSLGGAPTIGLGNIITGNKFGIYLRSGGTPIVDGNTIVANGTGIYIYGRNEADPIATIINNDIFDNTTWNLYLKKIEVPTVLSINNNWWGTEIVADIRATMGSYYADLNVLVPLDAVAMVTNQAIVLPGNVNISQQYISPAASSGIQDDVDFTADIGSSANWSVDIINNANQIVKTYSGTGTSININWDGKNASAQDVADGQYLFSISVNGNQLNHTLITIDNSAPLANFDASLNNAVLIVSPLQINGTAFDINQVNYKIEVANGFTPLEADYREIASTGSKVVDNTLMSWPFGDASNPIMGETQGDKTLRLTVTDAAGNITKSTVPLTLNHPSITNVSHDVYSISPTDGEQVTVSFDLGFPATVYLRFYPERDASQANLIAEVSENFSTASTKTLSWDGMGTGNVFLPDEAYRFELVTVNADTTVVFNRTDVLPTQGSCAVSQTILNSGQNKYFDFTCTVPQPVRVILSNGPTLNKPLDAGTHTLSWDLRNASNKIVDTQMQIYGPNFEPAIRKDSVIIKGNNPVITGNGAAPNIEVIATPHTVLHSFEQVSQIVYRLDQDANVTVRLLKPCLSSNTECSIDHDDPTTFTLVDNQFLEASDAGGEPIDHSFEWRGYDFNATTIDANNILVDEEGYFTFSIKAVSAASGLSTIYRGSLYLAH